jgi:hypothetical protein
MDTPDRPFADDGDNEPGTAPKRLSPGRALESASLDKLRGEWRRLYGKTTRRKLETLAKMFRTTGRVGPDPGLALKPGARLVREWHGRTHTVTVTEDGFEYAGTSYSSLTKVAKKISGVHWSGPRFFGLVRAGTSSQTRTANA